MRIRLTYSGRPGLFAGTESHEACLLCETCGEPITADRQGLFQVPVGTLPKDVTLRAVHKGACDDEPAASWGDLEQMLAGLLQGLGHDVEIRRKSIDEPGEPSS